MVEVGEHRQQEAEGLILEQQHLAAERLVAGSIGSMRHNSGSRHTQHTGPVRRSIGHIEQSSR